MGATRREVLTGAIATTAAPLVFRASDALAQETLPITVSAYRADRTAALADDRVGIEGCAVTFREDAIGDMNTHVFSGPGTREVTEIGLHPFMLAYANDGFRDYTLLPIFLLRQFRHKSIFIRTDRGIERPEDLRGRRIGTPSYSSTSLTWIRGILEDEYGVEPTEIEWVVSAADSSAEASGTASAQEKLLPDGIIITTGPKGLDDSDLLEQGLRRRAVSCRGAALLQRRQLGCRTALSGPSESRTGLLQTHRHLSDHARGRHPWRCRGRASLVSESGVRRVRRSQGAGLSADVAARLGHEHASVVRAGA